MNEKNKCDKANFKPVEIDGFKKKKHLHIDPLIGPHTELDNKNKPIEHYPSKQNIGVSRFLFSMGRKMSK